LAERINTMQMSQGKKMATARAPFIDKAGTPVAPLRAWEGCPADEMLHMAAKVMTQKVLADKLPATSRALLKKWLSGEAPSFLKRTEDFFDTIAKEGRKDIALAQMAFFAIRLGCVIVSEKQLKGLAQHGITIRTDEWSNE